MKEVLFLNSDDLEAAVHLDELREVMQRAFTALSQKEAVNFPRTVVAMNLESALGFMPAHCPSENLIGYKITSVFPGNRKRHLNPHQGLVALLDPETGKVQSLMDASTITALRTAAVSAVATDVLARKESSVLALIGAGRQAYEHARALCRVRPIREVFISNRTERIAYDLSGRLEQEFSLSTHVVSSPSQAVRESDIVVTCTASQTPLLHINDFPPGCHINAVGACRPGFREIDLETSPTLKIYLDHKEASSCDADEVFLPLRRERLDPLQVVGELGDLIKKEVEGRRAPTDVTFFKSVGLGVEDLFCADYFYRKLRNAAC